MSKPQCHITVPGTTETACGTHGSVRTAHVREDVTCKQCKRTDYFRALPNSKVRKDKSK
jgi:hypothetical protein